MASSESQNMHDGDSPWQERPASESVAQSQSRRNDESWVEIASQPSSSSLSSIGDQIVTTGLRVGGASQHQRRRRLAQQQQLQQQQQHQMAAYSNDGRPAGTSSQEEYDETESDDDRLMSSSAEHVGPPRPGLPAQQTAIRSVSVSDSSDDDDEATALGRPTSSPTFRPVPNAFSHPPTHLQHRSHSTSGSIPHHPPFRRPSLSHRSQTRVNKHRPNFMSPSCREDNDAALRASLTTLLSCAAAARGLPKKDGESSVAGPGPSGLGAGLRPSTQPMDLRLVPESELMEAEKPAPTLTPTSQPRGLQLLSAARTASNSSAPSGPASASSRDAAATAAAGKSKRTASSSAGQVKPPRAAKKKRTAAAAAAADGEASFLSPTLLTWVVSAGVVVLVSVVGFGAGYVIGRETGYREGQLGLGGGGGGVSAGVGLGGNATTSCSREFVKPSGSGAGTLRRFRWGGVARGVTAS